MEKVMMGLGYSRKLDSLDDQLSKKYKDMILEDRIDTVYSSSYDNHEVTYYKKINEVIGIHVEIKRATSSIPNKYIRDFLQHTQTISLDNFDVKTLDNTYTLIHLFSNTYHNTELSLFGGKNINLRDYFDTYNFLIKFYSNIDFDVFFNLCARYKLVYQVVYTTVLYNLRHAWNDVNRPSTSDMIGLRA